MIAAVELWVLILHLTTDDIFEKKIENKRKEKKTKHKKREKTNEKKYHPLNDFSQL